MGGQGGHGGQGGLLTSCAAEEVMLCLCLGGERHAAGEPGQRGEAAADGRAVRVALQAAAPLDVLRQEVRQSLLHLQLGKAPKKKLLPQGLKKN